MLIQRWWWAARTAYKLRGYEPQRVTFNSVLNWSKQFPPTYRTQLIRLAANLQLISEKETIAALLELNSRVTNALKEDGVNEKNLIYVTTDSAGSSSGVMLDLLRRWANLEKKGATFLHASDGEEIQKKTLELNVGAIIYVDDFAGTGKQFVRARKNVAAYIVGGFSEFFLVPCICEEALNRCKEIRVQAESKVTHYRQERPLLEESEFLSLDERQRLLTMIRERFGKKKISLGFDKLATNILIYRNAPNTTPLIFRGNLGQEPFHGIVPRFDDLPIEDEDYNKLPNKLQG